MPSLLAQVIQAHAKRPQDLWAGPCCKNRMQGDNMDKLSCFWKCLTWVPHGPLYQFQKGDPTIVVLPQATFQYPAPAPSLLCFTTASFFWPMPGPRHWSYAELNHGFWHINCSVPASGQEIAAHLQKVWSSDPNWGHCWEKKKSTGNCFLLCYLKQPPAAAYTEETKCKSHCELNVKLMLLKAHVTLGQMA